MSNRSYESPYKSPSIEAFFRYLSSRGVDNNFLSSFMNINNIHKKNLIILLDLIEEKKNNNNIIETIDEILQKHLKQAKQNLITINNLFQDMKYKDNNDNNYFQLTSENPTEDDCEVYQTKFNNYVYKMKILIQKKNRIAILIKNNIDESSLFEDKKIKRIFQVFESLNIDSPDNNFLELVDTIFEYCKNGIIVKINTENEFIYELKVKHKQTPDMEDSISGSKSNKEKFLIELKVLFNLIETEKKEQKLLQLQLQESTLDGGSSYHRKMNMKDIKDICKSNKIKLSRVVDGKWIVYNKKELITKLKRKKLL
jgi:hypothetical protein